MDSFEWNKIAGAVLFALLVAFGLSMLSGILFSTEKPESPGYVIAVAEPTAEGAKSGGPAAPQPIAVLLASADANAGQATAKKCAACHTFGQGEAPKVGPNLWGVVGRPIASTQFSYSDAMRAHAKEAGNWTYDNLNVFIHDPKGVVPGTKMAFAGLKDDAERANVIAYLRTLAATPEPLPAPPAAEASAAPAEGGAVQGGAAPAAGSAPAASGQAAAASGQAGGASGQAAAGSGQAQGAAGAQPAAGGAPAAPSVQQGGTSPEIQQPQGTLGPLQSTTADQQGSVPQVAPIEQAAPEPPAGQPAQQGGAPAQGQPAESAQSGGQTTQPAVKPPAPKVDQVAPAAPTATDPAVTPKPTPPAAAPQPAAAQPVAPTPAPPAQQQSSGAQGNGQAPAAQSASPAPAPETNPAAAAPAASAPAAPTALPSSTPAASTPAATTPVAPAPAAPATPPAAAPAPAAPQKSGQAEGAQQTAAAAAQAPGTPAASGFLALVAAASPANGQNVAKKCQICHDLTKAAANRVGPHLWDVVNRTVASVPNFSYSPAMVAYSEGGTKKWTMEQLGSYLENPKAHVPGTKMAFPGLPDENQRAQLVAYLRTLSDSPAPLPGAQ